MSDKTLDQLIASLKTEAIDAANKESERILEKANMHAQKAITAAEEKRDMIISEAEGQAKAILSKGESALRQAGRDYRIVVRNELLKTFQAVLEGEISKEFTPDLMQTAIMKVIDNVGGDVELKLSNEFSKELADYVHNQLITSNKLVSIIEGDTKLAGFSIAKKDQGWSYTISPEDISEELKHHLTNNWVNILNNETKS